MERLIARPRPVPPLSRESTTSTYSRRPTTVSTADACRLPSKSSAPTTLTVSPRTIEQFIGDFAMHISPLTPDIARHAAALRAQTPSLRLPDAFVLATGDNLGVASVLTGDAAWLKFGPRAVLI